MHKKNIIQRQGKTINIGKNNLWRKFEPISNPYQIYDGFNIMNIVGGSGSVLDNIGNQNTQDLFRASRAGQFADRIGNTVRGIAKGVAGVAGTAAGAADAYKYASALKDVSDLDASINATRNFTSNAGTLDALQTNAENQTFYDDVAKSRLKAHGTGSIIGNTAKDMGKTFLTAKGGLISKLGQTLAVGVAGGLGAARANQKALDEANRINSEQDEAMLAQRMALQDNLRRINDKQYGDFMLNNAINDFGGKLVNNDMKNGFAYGGEMKYTGDFSNGVTYVNNGGTHETSPIDGVPMGVDSNGSPNLVEEGEVIYDGYVFSNRLNPTKEILKEMDLPDKYHTYTFAKIAELLSKDSEERPNDPISRKTLESNMAKLQAAQEKLKEAAGIAERQNEQPSAEQQMAQEQMVQEQVPQEQIPQEQMLQQEQMMPQEGEVSNVTVPQEEQTPVSSNELAQRRMLENSMQRGFAYGGNIFDGLNGGSSIDNPIDWRTRLAIADQINKASMAVDNAMRGGSIMKNPIDWKTRLALSDQISKNIIAVNKAMKGRSESNNPIDWNTRMELADQISKNKIATDNILGNNPDNAPIDWNTRLALSDQISKARIATDNAMNGRSATDAMMNSSSAENPLDWKTRMELYDQISKNRIATENAMKGKPVAGNSMRNNYETENPIDWKTRLELSDQNNRNGIAIDKILGSGSDNAPLDWKTRLALSDQISKANIAVNNAMRGNPEAYSPIMGSSATSNPLDWKTRLELADRNSKAQAEINNTMNGFYDSWVGTLPISKAGSMLATIAPRNDYSRGLRNPGRENYEPGLPRFYVNEGNGVIKEQPRAVEEQPKAAEVQQKTRIEQPKAGVRQSRAAGVASSRKPVAQPSASTRDWGYLKPMYDTIDRTRVVHDNTYRNAPFEGELPDYGMNRGTLLESPDSGLAKRSQLDGQANVAAPAASAGNDVNRDNDGKLYATWMRYAPVIGSAVGVWNDRFGKGVDYSGPNAILAATRGFRDARFSPIGDYLTPDPLDRAYYLNQLGNASEGNARAIANSSANRGAAMAGLLASGNNYMSNIGNTLMQMEQYNDSNRNQVGQFNRGTDQYNSEGQLRADMANADIQRARLAGIQSAYQMRDYLDDRRRQGAAVNLTNLFNNIGDIGRENMAFNMVNQNRSQYYGITRNGKIFFKDAFYDLPEDQQRKLIQDMDGKQTTAACGGRISKRRK